MIKNENGKFYITAGEACYILSVVDGKLCHTYIGKRVEYEDDLTALGISPCPVPELDGFTVASSEVLGAKPDCPLTLPGNKTLLITLNNGDLTAEVYITPYSRGGFTRRTVIKNNGSVAASVNAPTVVTVAGGRPITLSADGEITENADNKDRACRYYGAATTGGGTYGFLSVFGDGEIAFGGDKYLSVTTGVKIKIGAGETVMFPEVLIAYSDGGVYGVSRVFHDIVREATAAARPQAVLFCPTLSAKKLCAAAAVACELGIDVFAVNGCEVDLKTLKQVGGACADTGIKLGIRVSLDGVGETSALKEINGATDEQIIDVVVGLVQEVGARYVMVDTPTDVKRYAKTVYVLRRRLSEAGVVLDFGAVNKHTHYAQSLCYPLCLLRSMVSRAEQSLKTQFDYATLGKLGYEFDPTELSPELLRAVRAQVFSYQDDAPIALGGDLFRVDGVLIAVSKDKSAAYAVCDTSYDRVRLIGLDEHNLYRVRELDKTFSGAALCSCGVPLPKTDKPATFTLHIRQVADFD